MNKHQIHPTWCKLLHPEPFSKNIRDLPRQRQKSGSNGNQNTLFLFQTPDIKLVHQTPEN